MKQKFSFIKHLIILLFFTSSVSCNDAPKKNTEMVDTNKYATHFSIINQEKYTILSVNEAWQGSKNFTYILKQKGAKIPDSLNQFPIINVPLNNIIVTSTTHLSGLEMLGVTNKLLAFPNTKYVSSKIFRNRIDQGKIIEIGNGMQLNTEKVLAIHPELIMIFSSGQDQKNYHIFEKNGIPVLYNADWMEKSPLGRAEWLKIFGLLFDKEEKANELFNNIVSQYETIQQKAKKGKHPTVFQGGQFGDKWYIPGGNSYAVQLISDAGGQYIWQDDKHTGSVNLNYENVLINLPKTQVWLNPGMIENSVQLIQEIPQSKNFTSFTNKQIYSYNLTKGKTGGVIYFESSNAHPNWVLDDLFHIFNPNIDSNYTFHYYKKLSN